MVQNNTGSIDLSKLSDRPRVIGSEGIIQKIKSRLKCNKRASYRKFAKQFRISQRPVRRILKDDLGLRPHKK